MYELVPYLQTARETILTRIFHPNFAFSSFSFAKNTQLRYGYDNESLYPESLQKTIDIFEHIPDSVSAKDKDSIPVSEKEAILKHLEQIVGGYGCNSGILQLLDEVRILAKINDLVLYSKSKSLSEKKIKKDVNALFQQNVSSLSMEALRFELKNARLIKANEVLKQLLDIISKLTKVSCLKTRHQNAIDTAISCLLSATAVLLNKLPFKKYQKEIKKFLSYVNDEKSMDPKKSVDSSSIDLQKLVGIAKVTEWAMANPVFALRIIESQWQHLSGVDIVAILVNYANKESVEFEDHIVLGLDIVNHVANELILDNPRFKEKLKSSSFAMAQIKTLSYSCRLWDLVDLKDFASILQKKADYIGIERFLSRVENEEFDLDSIPLTPRDICCWAKGDIRFAKTLLQLQSQHLSADDIVHIIKYYGNKVFIPYQGKRVAGLDGVEIVLKALGELAKARLFESSSAINEIKIYTSIYQEFCKTNLSLFLSRLKSTPVDECKNELGWLLTWNDNLRLNLVDTIGIEVVKCWAKYDSSIAFKIIESQWQHLSALDIVDILLAHGNQPNFVDDLSEILILESKEFCNKLIACERAMQQLKPYKHVHAALSQHCKPRAAEHDLPTVHPAVLSPINGQRRHSLGKSGRRESLSFTQVGDLSIFHFDENIDPNSVLPVKQFGP